MGWRLFGRARGLPGSRSRQTSRAELQSHACGLANAEEEDDGELALVVSVGRVVRVPLAGYRRHFLGFDLVAGLLFFAQSPPLWIPAFAGMTKGCHECPMRGCWSGLFS